MFFKYNLAAILWALVILALTLSPGSIMPDLPFWDLLRFDKVAHIFVFAVLVFQLAMGFYKQYRFRVLRYHALQSAFIFSVIYGGLIELLQGMLFHDRHTDVIDFIANTLGCIAGASLFHGLFKNIYLR
jgi:glycopeptide antibiotics resistance protein